MEYDAPHQAAAGVPIKSLFLRESSAGYQFLALALASIVLVVVDARTALLTPVRSALASVVAPLYYVADFPHAAGERTIGFLASHARLRSENDALRRQLLDLQGQVVRLDAVLQDNNRLHELFDSQLGQSLGDHNLLIAELVATSANPLEVVVDKGRLSGVAVGQAVIDSKGLLGQVVETTRFTSRVLLITDPSHSVPVQVLRSGIRAIAAGDGQGRLTLKDAAVTLDITDGDVLVSSGIGGRFPATYPVGVVQSVVRDQTDLFAHVVVRPSAEIDRARRVLVVFDATGGQLPWSQSEAAPASPRQAEATP